MTEIVQLTEEEMILAFSTGIKRQFAHRDPITGKRFSTHRFVAHDSDFMGDIKGCLVELAVAKYYGVQWNNETWNLKDHNANKGQADVGDRFEVRRARSPKGELTIRNTDAEHKIAILGYVDEASENFVHLLGAYPVEDAIKNYTQDGKGNRYIPIQSLLPVKDFALENA
jgi:hypothetical protein